MPRLMSAPATSKLTQPTFLISGRPPARRHPQAIQANKRSADVRPTGVTQAPSECLPSQTISTNRQKGLVCTWLGLSTGCSQILRTLSGGMNIQTRTRLARRHFNSSADCRIQQKKLQQRFRAGTRVPHPRHWETRLADLVLFPTADSWEVNQRMTVINQEAT